MNAKLFAIGLVVVLLAIYVKQVSIPWVGTEDWNIAGFHVQVPTMTSITPFGFLAYPMMLFGAVCLIFGIFKNNALRVFLVVCSFALILYFHIVVQTLSVWV
jgi:hypothetical protein